MRAEAPGAKAALPCVVCSVCLSALTPRRLVLCPRRPAARPAGPRGSVCQLAHPHQPRRVPVAGHLPAHPAAQPPQRPQAPQHEGKRGMPKSCSIRRTFQPRVGTSWGRWGRGRRRGPGGRRDARCTALRSALPSALLSALCRCRPGCRRDKSRHPRVLFAGSSHRAREGFWGVTSPPDTHVCTHIAVKACW